MATYSAGTATVDVVPSLKGFHTAIKRELATINPTVDVTANIRQAQRQIAQLTRINPTINVDVKVRKAEAGVASAIKAIETAEKSLADARTTSEDATKRVEIAEKQLEETRSRSNVKGSQIAQSELKLVQARRAAASAVRDIETAERRLVSARNDRTNRERDLFDARGAAQVAQGILQAGQAAAGAGDMFAKLGTQAVSAFTGISGSASSVVGPIGSVVAAGLGIGSIVSLGSAAAASLIGLGQAAITASGALLLIPAGLSVGGAILGTFALGTMGVTDALQAMSKAQTTAGKDAQSNARQQRAAADAIASAETSLSRAVEDAAQAREDAADRVAQAVEQRSRAVREATRAEIQAERAVIDAERDRDRALDALTKSIEDAQRAQRDLNLQVRGGALDAREAALDLADAESALNNARASGADGEALERLTIAYERARLQVDQTAASNGDLVDQQKAYAKEGLKANSAVVSATEAVQRAEQQLADARDAQEHQRVQGQEQIADASRAVVDAQKAQDQAAKQAQRSIADAQKAVATAQANAADSLDKLSSSQEAVKEALAALSPEARQFVDEVMRLKPAFDDVKNSVQDALFNGLAEKLTELSNTYLPILKSRLTDIATAANGAAQEIVDLLTDPQNAGAVNHILEQTADIVAEIGDVMKPLIQAFLDLAEVGVDVLKDDVVPAAKDGAQAFADWIREMKNSGQLKDWMSGAVDLLKNIVVFAVSAGKALVNVITSLNKGVAASGFYDKIGQLFNDFVNFAGSEDGKRFFEDFGRTIGDIATFVLKILEFIGQVMKLWDTIDRGIRQITGGAAGLFEVLVRIFLFVQTLGLSELILSLFRIDWEKVKNWFSTGAGEVLGRVVLAITTFGISELLIAMFSIDWSKVKDWFSHGTGEVLGRVVLAISTFGISELLTAVFSLDWDHIIQGFTDGLGKLGRAIRDKIEEIPVIGQLFKLTEGGIVNPGDFFRNQGGGFNLGFADGGYVAGPGTGTSDSIPALLSNGEYVMTARQTAKFLPVLEAMRANRFASGGLVGSVSSSSSKPLAIAGSADTTGLVAVQETADAAFASLQALADFIATVMVPAFDALAASNLLATNGMVTNANTLSARHALLAQQLAAYWQAITSTVNASVSAQSVAFGNLTTGMGNVRSAMQYTADWAVSQWNRIRAAAADPIRWVLQVPMNNGLIAAWNKLNGDFALGKAVDPIPVGFATGGYTGDGGTYEPKGVVHGGEFVIRKAITKKARPFLEALNAGQPEALQAVGLPGYASGGLVDIHGQRVGAALAAAAQFAKAESGKPYIWGGVGPVGYDCSGFMSAITNVLRGENPHKRLGVAASEPWPGFARGLGGAFALGASSVHTAGTLAGVNVESGGSPSRVKYGVGAVGADNGQFPTKSFLPLVGGSFVSGGAGGGFDAMSVVGNAFAQALADAGSTAGRWPGNRAADFAGSVATQAVQAVQTKAVEALSAALSPTGAGVEQWRGLVLQALARVGQAADLVDVVLRRMSQESTGNPRAFNDWDINAKRGTPSKGLMQVIDPTFQAYRDPTLVNDIWDPLANLVASMRYTLHRYGSLPAGYNRPGGYSRGGVVPGFGSRDTEPAFLTPGERVLPVSVTRTFDRFVSNLATADRLAATAASTSRSEGISVTNHVYPAPGMDERALAADTSRRTAFAIRNA